MGIQEQGWFMNIIRSIFCFLDGIVYGLIKWILFGIFDLANITTNSEVFNGIYSRIYVILGIFMAFKLSFSFFQYIIDPESISGKSEKSLSKVFSRVFVMLAALIFLPMVLFGQNGNEGLLSRAQRAFLPTLPKLMFGVDSLGGLSNSSGVGTGETFSESIEQAADDITVTILSGFFAPPEDLDNYCDDGTYENTPPIKSMDDFRANVNLDCPKRGDILAHVDFTGVASTAGLAAKYYKYSYMWFISTIVGVLVALLLLSVTLDIAKRIFKLMILEVIAPIPIMSLIDPKGSKDGAFRKWVSSLSSTFLDIFFKLGMVYLVIVFIHLIVNSGSDGGIFKNFPTNTGFRGTYLTILLVLGLILFAKEAPKFIKEAMGFKDKGGGLFDDVKTLGKAAGLVAGGAGVIGSTVASARANYLSDTENGRRHHIGNIMKNVGAGALGGIAGLGTGIKAATGKDGSVSNVIKAQSQRNANVIQRGASGSTWLGRRSSELQGIFTGDTEAARLEREIAANEANQAYLKAITDRASSEMPKSNYTFGTLGKKRDGSNFVDIAGNSLQNARFNYKEMMASYKAASAAGLNYVTIQDEAGVSHDISTKDIEFGTGNLLKENEEDYLLKVNNNSYTHLDSSGNVVFDIDDSNIATYMDNVTNARIRDANGNNVNVRSRGNLKKTYDHLGTQSSRMKQRQGRAKANDRYSASKK